MKKSTAWIIGSIVIVAVAAMIVPGSPFNILDRFIMNNQLFTAQHDGRTVTEWIGDLNETDDAKKILAIKALGSLSVNAKQALPQLAKIMTLDPDTTMRIEASLAISKMAPDSLSVLDSLIKGLDDKDAVVRMNSLFGIMRLKADSKGALKALVAAANLPVNQELPTGFTTTLQESLLVAIGRASAGSSESVPMLMGLLNSKDNPNLRLPAMRGLAEVGPPAKEAAGEIRKILKDKASPNELRQEAFDALERIGDPSPKSDLVFEALPPAMAPPGGKGGPGGPGGPGGGKGGPGGPGGGKGGPGGGKGDFKKGDFKKSSPGEGKSGPAGGQG